MGKQKKVRIGFVGVGSMGQCAHLRNYVTIPDCEVVAIAEIRPQLAEKVAARYGVPAVYRDHHAMLASEDLDGVVASQMFDCHATLLPEIYGRVKCVFTEKPLAISVSAGEKLAQLAAKTKTVHMVGYHKRSDPATEYVKNIIDTWKKSGEMGTMKYVRILMPSGDWIANGFRELITSDEPLPPIKREPPMTELKGAVNGKPMWDWKPPAGDYVRFVNYYIHQVNLLRYLLGEPYEVAYADPSGVVMAVESRSGIPGVIEMSPYSTTVEWKESALIAFEHGYIRLSLPAPLACNRAGHVEIYRDPKPGQTPQRISPTLPWVHAMRRQAENFVAVCQGKKRPPCDATEAVEDLRVALQYIRLRFAGKR